MERRVGRIAPSVDLRARVAVLEAVHQRRGVCKGVSGVSIHVPAHVRLDVDVIERAGAIVGLFGRRVSCGQLSLDGCVCRGRTEDSRDSTDVTSVSESPQLERGDRGGVDDAAFTKW